MNLTRQNAATAEEMNDQAERMKRFVDELTVLVAGGGTARRIGVKRPHDAFPAKEA